MIKTINALNAYWSGKWAAITASEGPDDYVIGKIDRFEWLVAEDYEQTQMPKLKVIFSEVLEPGDPTEPVIEVSTFSIKEYSA